MNTISKIVKAMPRSTSKPMVAPKGFQKIMAKMPAKMAQKTAPKNSAAVVTKNVSTPIRNSAPAKALAIKQIKKAALMPTFKQPAKTAAILNKRPAIMKPLQAQKVKPAANQIVQSRPAFGPDFKMSTSIKQDTQSFGPSLIKDSFKPIDMPLEKKSIVKKYTIPGFPIELSINTAAIQPMI